MESENFITRHLASEENTRTWLGDTLRGILTSGTLERVRRVPHTHTVRSATF